ncbi:MAG: hypothetical protein KJ882_10560 [Proteobacteria bacterium]|nr:hypothetical protein [Pseudomonadota bacterium]MBU4011193.1 hypothetical protein [Pseudomonadota bacterium]
MFEQTEDPSGSDSDAEFLGWQETLSEDIFPLYTITVADHPSYHSTVSDKTLRTLGLRIPRTPSSYAEIVPSRRHNLGIELNRHNPRYEKPGRVEEEKQDKNYNDNSFTRL